MDKQLALWGTLKLRGDLAQSTTLPAEEVRSIGASLGFDDEGLLRAVTELSEKGLVRLHWGGGVQALEPKPEQAGAPAGGIIFQGPVHGNVIQSTGSNARFDLRTYNQAPPDMLEAIVAGLAAAAAELRTRAIGLPAEEAAQVTVVADAAGEVAHEAQEKAPDKPRLIERLNTVTAGVESLGKLQKGIEQLRPTLQVLQTAATAALAYFGLGG
jgi:hypothetical protein